MRPWCILVLCCVGLPSGALAQDISVTAASSYLTGRYGAAEATTATVSFVTVQGSFSDFQLAATLPYVFLKSGGQFSEVGGILVPAGGDRVRGFADLILSIDCPLPLGDEAPLAMAASAFVKVPTGASSISTGEFDGGVDLEISKNIGKIAPFLKAGYRFYGDSAELELRNGWAASAGATLSLGKLILIGSYDWEESSFGGPTSKELYGLVNGPLAPRFRWTVFGSKGLSQGAADARVGAALTLSFGGETVSKMPRR